ncbi:hypothetical protein [Marinobacter sp. F4206]|uniref:hypothetical protein n=1 Tax=Marinobacter sp. F4206 TaxID=2861777 RepID=UPI001C5F3E91|nr:hypothetical protein [Marinobacter sp. F4206]MBW4933948.1 hypothetical protein [Marinobacter sp. F4206]
MPEFVRALEQTALAQALGESVWLYPLVNAGHILGIALLVGGIVPLDLRLLGLWKALPLAPFWRVLRVSAATGLALAIVTGSLLFLTRASDYLESVWFQSKLLVILASLVNIAVVMARYGSVVENGGVTAGLRASALISLCGWIMALLLGRLVGYF